MDELAGAYDREHVAQFYDHVYGPKERKDVDFYVDLAKETTGSVLELGCGTGRVLLPTARAGFDVTGIDLSEDMLEVLQTKLVDEPEDVQQRVRIVRADIRDFALGARFELVTVPFRPFQHLISIDDQLACLSCAHRHLEPGGRLALDVFDPNLGFLMNLNTEEIEDSSPSRMPDGRTVARKHRTPAVDLHSQLMDMELIYEITDAEKEERIVHAFKFRYFFRYEMEHLLARAGFELEALYSDFERSQYGSNRPEQLVFVARRA